MTHNIFLSYSRDDTSLMKRLRDDFRQVGFTTWTDEHIEPGAPSWKIEIEDAIRRSACMVVIFSPSAAESHWVRAELDFAEAQKKRIFSILALGDESNAVPFGYTSHQWIDMRDSKAYDNSFRQLAEVIANYLQITPFGLTVLQRTSHPIVADVGGIPLRFAVPFIIAVLVLGFVGLMALNQQLDSATQTPTPTLVATRPTATIENTAIPTGNTTNGGPCGTIAPSTLLENAPQANWTQYTTSHIQFAVQTRQWRNREQSDVLATMIDTICATADSELAEGNEILAQLMQIYGESGPEVVLLHNTTFAVLISSVDHINLPGTDPTIDDMHTLITDSITTVGGSTIVQDEFVTLPQGDALRLEWQYEDSERIFHIIVYSFLRDNDIYSTWAILQNPQASQIGILDDSLTAVMQTYRIIDGEAPSAEATESP